MSNDFKAGDKVLVIGTYHYSSIGNNAYVSFDRNGSYSSCSLIDEKQIINLNKSHLDKESVISLLKKIFSRVSF